MTKFVDFVIFIGCFLLIFAVLLFAFKVRGENMRNYELTHNCRYDYNELCYTQEERPWLFND